MDFPGPDSTADYYCLLVVQSWRLECQVFVKHFPLVLASNQLFLTPLLTLLKPTILISVNPTACQVWAPQQLFVQKAALVIKLSVYCFQPFKVFLGLVECLRNIFGCATLSQTENSNLASFFLLQKSRLVPDFDYLVLLVQLVSIAQTIHNQMIKFGVLMTILVCFFGYFKVVCLSSSFSQTDLCKICPPKLPRCLSAPVQVLQALRSIFRPWAILASTQLRNYLQKATL